MEVSFTEALGANTLLHGKLIGSGTNFTVSLVGVHPVVDPTIKLSVANNNIHLFDADSGKVIVNS